MKKSVRKEITRMVASLPDKIYEVRVKVFINNGWTVQRIARKVNHVKRAKEAYIMGGLDAIHNYINTTKSNTWKRRWNR